MMRADTSEGKLRFLERIVSSLGGLCVELRKYFHHLVISSSYIVDPISRQHINIMEQCVSPKVLEGDDKGDCLSKGREIDAQVEKAMAATVQRVAALCKRSDHAPRIDESQISTK